MDTTPPVRRGDVPSAPAEAFVLVVTAIVIAAFGVPLGAAWSALAPRVELVMSGGSALYNPETEVFAAADGWFTLLGLAAGFVTALVCWLTLRRYRGPFMLLAVVVGAAGAAAVTWQVGIRVDEADFRYLLTHAATGWTFPGPLRLGAKGALAAQPLVAALVYTVIAGCSRYASLYKARSTRRERRAAAPPAPEHMPPQPDPVPAAQQQVPQPAPMEQPAGPTFTPPSAGSAGPALPGMAVNPNGRTDPQAGRSDDPPTLELPTLPRPPAGQQPSGGQPPVPPAVWPEAPWRR